jgi:hypothetical protein
VNPFQQLAEAWKVARADKLFEPVHPTAALVNRMADADPYFAEVPARVHEVIATKALELATQYIGHGEEGGNNRGPFIDLLVSPARAPQNWCAAFVGFCYQTAAFHIGIPLPFKRSLGAKRLGENIAAVGRKFTDPREAKPGDAMVFHRGVTGSWQGHIAMVERIFLDQTLPYPGEVAVKTVEGNAGPKVMRKMRHPSRDRFAFFASLHR